jgi:hypothetical protein
MFRQEVTGALLYYGDDEFVFQQRSLDVKRNPGRIGLFGGQLHAGEHPDFGIRRELGEEIVPVKFMGGVVLRRLGAYEIDSQVTGRDNIVYYLYSANINSYPLDSREGQAKIRSLEWFLGMCHESPDMVSPAASYVVQRALQEGAEEWRLALQI